MLHTCFYLGVYVAIVLYLIGVFHACQLRLLFEEYGSVVEAVLCFDKYTGHQKGMQYHHLCFLCVCEILIIIIIGLIM